jgi:arylsulfatase A-like enzyme
MQMSTPPTRLGFARGYSAALLAAVASCASPSTPVPCASNVVVIVVDDVGCDLIGAYEQYWRARGRAAGSPAATPCIDRELAAQGVMFTQAWSAPACTPSRARLLTGLRSHHNGIGSVIKAHDDERGGVNVGLSLEAQLLPQALRESPAHYASAAVGKWHLGDARTLAQFPHHPLGEPPGTWFGYYAGSMFNLQAPDDSGRRAGYYNWEKTLSVAPSRGFALPRADDAPIVEAMQVPPADNYPTTDTTDDAIALLGALPKPFFLYVSYNAAHAPVHALPPVAEAAHSTGFPDRLREMVGDLDRQIGRLLQAVDGRDTTVVFLGDNGTESRGLAAPFDADRGKGTLYEGGCRVPMIVRSPLVPQSVRGSACDALVEMNDLFATFVELAGGELASEVAQDSRSLLPLLRGEASEVRDLAYTELFHPNFEPPSASPSVRRHAQAVRDTRYKLLRFTTRERDEVRVEEELFDLATETASSDWFEQRNLLDAPLGVEAAAALARLRSALDRDVPSLAR